MTNLTWTFPERDFIVSQILHCQPDLLELVIKLLNERDVKIKKIASFIALDPITTLEVIRTGNDEFYTKNQPPVSSIEPAIVRIGLSSFEHFVRAAVLTLNEALAEIENSLARSKQAEVS